MPAIVLVSGYGRSGSTLLDVLLASRLDDVVGAGELVNLFEELAHGGRCECGAAVADCPVWREVAAAPAAAGLSLEAARQVTRRGNSILARSIFGRPGAAYRALWGEVLPRLARSGQGRVIVDSSKVTRTRFNYAANLHAMGAPLVILHLVRDPDGVVASLRKGSNRALEQGVEADSPAHVVRGVFGWLTGNLGTEYLVRRTGAPRRMVSYEMLMSSEPYRRELIDWVAARAGVRANGSSGPVLRRGHGISGNRIRRMGTEPIELQPSTPPRPAHRLDRAASWLLRIMGRALGYGRS